MLFFTVATANLALQVALATVGSPKPFAATFVTIGACLWVLSLVLLVKEL